MHHTILNPVFLSLFLAGIGFIVGGIIQKKYPPKQLNGFYGYRTPRARKTQASWEYAQHFSAKKLIAAGIIALAIAPIGFLLADLDEEMLLLIAISSSLSLAALPIFLTERALKEKSDQRNAT